MRPVHCVRRWALTLWHRQMTIWVIVAIGLGTYATVSAVKSGRADDDRDEARKYQACEQRLEATANANVLATVTRGSLLTAARRQTLQARKTTDDELRERFTLGARLALERRRRVQVSPLPECGRIYPEGRRLTARYPDLAPERTGPNR